MRLKEIPYLLGFRPAVRTYGYAVRSFDLPADGRVEFACWLHPGEKEKILQQSVIDELRRFLNPGDVAIDIGAHTGDSSLPIALAVGPTGCVLAFEPNRYVYPVLLKNSELNRDKTNIIPLPFAATPQDGQFEFEYSDAGFCNGGRHEGVSKWRHGHAFKLEVEGRNLEAYLRSHHADLVDRLRYIKVDTEGFDHAVLKSVSSLLETKRPYIRAEVFKRTSRMQRREFLSFLSGLGYVIHHLDDEANYRGLEIGPDDVMRWRHYDIFCEPRLSADLSP